MEKELMDMYFQTAKECLTELEQTMTQGSDNTRWKAASHRLKGASGNLGAQQLYHACAVAEENAHNTPQEKITYLDNILTEAQKLQRFANQRHGENW